MCRDNGQKEKTEVLSKLFLLLPSCKHHAMKNTCIHTHTHTHLEQSSWKLLPSGRCPGDTSISGTSQNRWLQPSDCYWTYLCRKVSFAVGRLGTVTLGKLDCVWRPRGLFSTLQLVWQAPPPPESATGMGNTRQSGVRQLCQGTVSSTFVLHTKPTVMATFWAGDFPVPCSWWESSKSLHEAFISTLQLWDHVLFKWILYWLVTKI